MVLLTMTPAILEALHKLESVKSLPQTTNDQDSHGEAADDIEIEASESNTEDIHKERLQSSAAKLYGDSTGEVESAEPTLFGAEVGNPITHGQIIEIARDMKRENLLPQSLEILLRGAKVYAAPLPLKPEPTSEYKALMARLRRDEEERLYERMTNPPPPMETFNQSFPTSSAVHAFSDSQSIHTAQQDDDLTFADVDKQMALILNVLLSIVACAAAIWIAARWWSTSARLALSMSGGMLVGVAEVVVYSGYIRRLGEAKGKEKALIEIKEIVNTWTVGAGQDNKTPEDQDGPVLIETKDDETEASVRKRRNDS